MQELTNKILGGYGFTDLGDPTSFSDVESDDDAEQYRGWIINPEAPNGGMLAIDLIHIDRGLWWGFPTEGTFDYHENAKAIAWAKDIVDEIEMAIDLADCAANGQLTITWEASGILTEGGRSK